MIQPAESDQDVERFISGLESIPWFRNIGKPTPSDAGVERICSWDEWPGPEEPGISALSDRQQALYDSLTRDSRGETDPRTLLWNRIHEAVFRTAAPKVPYDANQDCYHAPSMAVWQAAWTAGLVGLCHYSAQPIPPELHEQWEWFVRGHWPSGYVSLGGWTLEDDWSEQHGPLLVY
jgi:hypothetical protein